jgi:RNA polymerase sigma-70 factor (ECF subfamily)
MERLADLLSAARAGERGARERLYRALAPKVAAYLRTQRVDDVAGVTNDVFATVFRGLDRFAGTAAQFRSWVFTIAHAAAIDEQRYRSRRRRSGTVVPLTEADDRPAGDVEQDAIGSLSRAEVERLLAPLTADQRAVLLMRVVADLSVEETAAALGKAPGAVRVLQHRAVASLRRALAGEAVR